MNVHDARLGPSRTPSSRSRARLPRAGALAAGLTLAALLAAAVASASTADGVGYGQQVDLTLTGVSGDDTRILSGPEPRLAVAAPPADALQGSFDSTRVGAPAGLGTLLAAGRITIEAAASADIGLDHAAAGVTVHDVRLDLAGLLILTAGTITGNAHVLPDDGVTCWSGTLGGGSASFQRATLGGSLVPTPIALPSVVPPDYVLFEQPGVATVTLNKQVNADGRVTVHAVHVEVHELTVLGVGTLRGHVQLAGAEAVLVCGGANVAVSIAESGDPNGFGEVRTLVAKVSNLGPERAIDTLVALPLAASLDPLSATPSRGSCAIIGLTVTCALGELEAGEAVTVEVAVTPAHRGAVAVPADAAAANYDPAPRDNHACAMVLVPAAGRKGADLEVGVTASAATVYVGEVLTYTVVVRHGGGIEVPATLASLDLPFGTFLLSAAPAQGSCTGDRLVVCDLGTMTAGQQVAVTVDVLVLTSGKLQADGFVSSELDDPAVTDNFHRQIIEARDPGA